MTKTIAVGKTDFAITEYLGRRNVPYKLEPLKGNAKAMFLYRNQKDPEFLFSVPVPFGSNPQAVGKHWFSDADGELKLTNRRNLA